MVINWEDALNREKKVLDIITRQEQHGILFDVEKAEQHVITLDGMMKEIEDFVEPQLPLRRLPKSRTRYPPKNQFKKDGTLSANTIKYFGECSEDESGWYVNSTGLRLPSHEPLITHEPMTLANQADIKDWLISQGWKPTMWNFKKDSNGKLKRPLEKSTPKFTDQFKNLCPNLERLNGELVRPIVNWLSYRNRRNVIRSDNGTGWLHSVKENGRIPSGADTLGTNTGRFTHKGVANVPRVSSIFGKEMRELFTTDDDNYFIGWDASGLEARIEGHYTYKYDGGEYARELVEGDVHSNNAAVFGCDRNTAKGGKYCLSYGGGAPKLAETIGVSKKEGERLYAEFWKANWALSNLKDNLTKFWKTTGKRKWILGLDGRKIYTRSEHSLVNALFQSGGAICMKEAMVLMDAWAKDYDANGLVRYHDEEQWEVSKKLVEFKMFSSKDEAKDFICPEGRIWGTVQEVDGKVFRAYSIIGELGVKSIRQAGENLKLNIALDAEYNVGRSWAETH